MTCKEKNEEDDDDEEEIHSYRNNIVSVHHDEDASILSDTHLHYLNKKTRLSIRINRDELTNTSYQSFIIRTRQ
jgi:hypothetical protein